MTPVDITEQAVGMDGVRPVVFAKDQPQYIPLPALIFPDGTVLTEWTFTEEERRRILTGEHLRLWVTVYPTRCEGCGRVAHGKLQPVAVEITAVDRG